eukprot:879522-Amphidinium_carterae.1
MEAMKALTGTCFAISEQNKKGLVQGQPPAATRAREVLPLHSGEMMLSWTLGMTAAAETLCNLTSAARADGTYGSTIER